MLTNVNTQIAVGVNPMICCFHPLLIENKESKPQGYDKVAAF